MNDTDYQAVIATYQQKAFELFNQNIVYETQISTLKAQIDALKKELEKYTSTNKRSEELY
jgi:prefoldin subunit 5